MGTIFKNKTPKVSSIKKETNPTLKRIKDFKIHVLTKEEIEKQRIKSYPLAF